MKPIKHGNGWRIRWTDENGRRRSAVLPTLKAANLALQRRRLEVKERKLGLRPPELERRVFQDAADYWRQHRVPHKRTGSNDESILRQLEPIFGRVVLEDMAAILVAVDRYRAIKGHLNRKTLRNHLVLLGSVLRMAHQLGWMSRLPHIQKPKVKLLSSDYSYLRTEAEIQTFLRAAQEEGEIVYVLYATAIFTGLRAGELAGLRWEDVDFEKRLITVQRSYDGPTKSDEVRRVPILDAVLPLLRRWRLKHPGMLVFTNRDGGMLAKSGRIFQEVLHRVLERAELPMVERGGRLRRYLKFHDLRHSFASSWVANGGDLFRLQKILGHESAAMTQRYAHLAPDAYRDDWGRLGPEVATGAAVLPLRKYGRL